MGDVVKILAHSKIGRLETGAIQESDDWPGLFIRGDDCIGKLLPVFEGWLQESDTREGVASPNAKNPDLVVWVEDLVEIIRNDVWVGGPDE